MKKTVVLVIGLLVAGIAAGACADDGKCGSDKLSCTGKNLFADVSCAVSRMFGKDCCTKDNTCAAHAKAAADKGTADKAAGTTNCNWTCGKAVK